MYKLKMMRIITLILIFLMIFLDLATLLGEESEYYTVIEFPSPDDPCNETERCLTLSQFANNSTDYLRTNTALYFLQGEQHLDSTILVENINTFNMSSCDSNVIIVCNHSSARFEFKNVSVVHISGLTFIGCAGNKFTQINHFKLEDSQFIGRKKGTALELIETSATFIRTKFSHNYGSNVISLYCENGNDINALYNFLYVDDNYEAIEVSVTAGGAIVSNHSSVTIIGSTFKGNSAQAGGVIFAELQSNITIINSTFVENQATPLQSHQYCYVGGGVLYSDSGSSAVVRVQNSTFKHNTAHWIGGVMATGRSTHNNFTIIIINSNFLNNTANYNGGVLSSGGDHLKVTIIDSEFTNDSVDYGGGSLYLRDSDHSNITIIDSEFTNDSAGHNGGSLYLPNSDHSNITIIDSEFTNDSAGHNGGSLYLPNSDHSNITIIDSEFTNDSAGREGGSLYLPNSDHSNITIIDSEFTNDSAGHYGGSLYLANSDHSNITIIDSEFTNNSAGHAGGSLYLAGSDHSNITIIDSEFTNNSAGYAGGSLSLDYSNHSNITIIDSEFTSNKVYQLPGRGGAISTYSHENITVIINSCNFTNNSAIYGGVVYIFYGGALNSQSTNVSITQSTFLDNQADSSGGTMYIHYGEVTINSSEFYHNIAKFGGVLRALNANISSHNTSLSHNTAYTDGGVLFARKSTTMIIGTNFSHNRAVNNGGVLKTEDTNVTITQCTFGDNKANSDGGTIHIQKGKFNISFSQFHHNTANLGGVLWIQNANINSHDITLSYNTAYTDGGVLNARESTTMIIGANFTHNRADNNGGIMYTDKAMTSITDCNFNHNRAGNDGGIMRSYQSIIDISESEYNNSSANNEGGAFYIDQTNLTVNQTSFTYSKAKDGGVIWTDQGVLIINQSTFVNSNASAGGVIWAEQTTIIADIVNISCNYANFGVVYLLKSHSDWSGIWYSNNIGSLYAFGGAVTVRDKSNLTNNTQPNCSHRQTKEGGAITVMHSEIKFYGSSLLTNDKAESGGALKAIGHSKVHVFGDVTIANNTATEAGGGIYLDNSELTCWKGSTLEIQNNEARENGGGISATGSHIEIEINNPLVNERVSNLTFRSNKAVRGGGLFLKMDSNIYVMKSINTSKSMIIFSFNSAEYGGAIYVSDNGTCSVSTESTVNECFIQSIAMYAPMATDSDPNDTRCQTINFVNNTADLSGNSLFGGLLDRCSVSQFAETNINNVNMDYTFSNGTVIVQGYEYFKKISNIKRADIDSPPVRVCFCISGQPNCSHQHEPIQVRRGQQKNISLSLAIVNQIHDPLKEAIILSHFRSGNYICQNHIQIMDGSCSNVDFAVSSKNDTEELILSLDEGPCKDASESKARVTLEFYCPKCLVGFELDEDEEGCQCVCDSQLLPHFTNCLGETLIRERNVWVTNLTTNNTSNIHQYLIHPYCPFDYCHPPSSRLEINLNIPNGADAQCANHHAGLLCGICQHNFSLSLGSSHCLPCSTHWYAVLIAILIAAILAGIILVALLLVLNLTVAIGTLNGIIFYANIVYANNTLFLPFTEPFNFITAFISWLNLEIGFDTCFFVGMDAYSKTLLQLAFPGYVFFLVFVVIIISKHSMRFSQLIGKRNPVATLATLIFLSYAKFLHITIASLSFAILKYPDGSHTYVWLVDASVGYLSGRHIALFIIALLIIIAGVCYTALLLFWQWLLRHQDKTLFRWTKYQKLCHFIEPYHAPYIDKHRYWAGLLFLVRVVLYIVFALNVNGDPHVSLVAIILTIGGLLLTKGFLVKVYKKWPIDVMELIMYFNILGFAALTWYYIGSPQRQTAVAYTSVTITFLFLLMVIAFHVYKFTQLGSAIQNAEVFKVLAGKLLVNKEAVEVVDKNSEEPEHREREVTFSVVEVPKPIFERPESEIHIELKPQELQCYTPANSLEEQESETNAESQ